MSLKGKILLIGLGLGVGYILGAKAGRERYDQIAKAADGVWNAPLVKDIREVSTTFVHNRLDDLGGLLKRGASNVIDRATGTKQRATKASTSTAAAKRSTSTAARRPSTSSRSSGSSAKTTKPAESS